MEQKAQTRRGVRTDPDIVQAIQDLRRLGRNAAQMKRELDNREEFRGRVPELRTVQAIVKRVSPPDLGDAWSVFDATAEEALLVLPVQGWWRHLAEDGPGQRMGFEGLTRREAAWVAKLVRISGNRLHPQVLLDLADMCIAAETDDDPRRLRRAVVEDLLAVLAAVEWSPKILSRGGLRIAALRRSNLEPAMDMVRWMKDWVETRRRNEGAQD
jgi:hypothetical protein